MRCPILSYAKREPPWSREVATYSTSHTKMDKNPKNRNLERCGSPPEIESVEFI